MWRSSFDTRQPAAHLTSKVELVLEMVSPGAAAVGYSVIICYLLLK